MGKRRKSEESTNEKNNSTELDSYIELLNKVGMPSEEEKKYSEEVIDSFKREYRKNKPIGLVSDYEKSKKIIKHNEKIKENIDNTSTNEVQNKKDDDNDSQHFLINKEEANRLKLDRFYRYYSLGFVLKDIKEIMQLTNIELDEFQRYAAERAKKEVKGLDFFSVVGETIAFYKQTKTEILRMAIKLDSQTQPVKKAQLYSRVLDIEKEMQEYLKTTGFYDVHRIIPKNDDNEESDVKKAKNLGKFATELLNKFNDINSEVSKEYNNLDDEDEQLED